MEELKRCVNPKDHIRTCDLNNLRFQESPNKSKSVERDVVRWFLECLQRVQAGEMRELAEIREYIESKLGEIHQPINQWSLMVGCNLGSFRCTSHYLHHLLKVTEHRHQLAEIIAEKDKIIRDKDEVIAGKDKAVREKDLRFQSSLTPMLAKTKRLAKKKRVFYPNYLKKTCNG